MAEYPGRLFDLVGVVAIIFPGSAVLPLLDLASNIFTVSLTLVFGFGGTTGFVEGDFSGLLISGNPVALFLMTPAEAALGGEDEALTDNFSSSLFGKDIGLGIRDLLLRLVLPLAALPPEVTQEDPSDPVVGVLVQAQLLQCSRFLKTSALVISSRILSLKGMSIWKGML